MTAHPPNAPQENAQRELDALSNSGHFHPLDAIGFFRRWPHSFLRSVVYTLIFNLMFAVGFTLLAFIFVRKFAVGDVAALLFENIVISNVIGFSFWLVLSLLSQYCNTFACGHFGGSRCFTPRSAQQS